MRLPAVNRTEALIFAAAGVVALALWGAIGYALHAAERDDLARADIDGRNLARSLAEHVASSVRAVDIVLLHLRSDWTDSRAPFSTHAARQRENLKRENVSQVVVADANGRIVYSSLPGFAGIDVSDRPFFVAQRAAGAAGGRDLWIGAPSIDPMLKQWTIKFARPIHDRDGRFDGVLALFVPPPGLARIYNDIDLGAGAVISLVRADGQILSRSPDLHKMSQVSLAGIPALRDAAPPAGGYRFRARTDGVERLYRYQKVPGYPLTLFVGQSMDAVTAPYRALRADYLAGGALATALLLAAALLLVYRRRDRRAAERVHAGLEEELRQGEEKLRLIAETIDEVVWSADAGIGKNFYISAAYERVWGRTRRSLQENPRSFVDAIHPGDRERVLANLEIQKHGLPFEHEYRIVRPDGSVRWIWDRGFPARGDDGAVLRYVGAAQDITQRKQAEQALQAQIAHLQLIYDASSAALFDVDGRGVITHANQRMAQMFGTTLAGVIGSRYLDHVHADEREAASESMIALMAGKASVLDRERRYRRADGGEFWGHITGRRILDAGGNATGLVGVLVDITELRLAGEALRRNEARLREVLDTFPIAVAHVDSAERITFANRFYRQQFGDDYRGRSVREYAGDEVYAVLQPLIRRALAGEPVQLERDFIGADGTARSGLLRYFPDRDADGAVAGYFVFREDVTERRLAEEQIRRLNEDLERRVRERTAELSAANAALQAEVRERRLAESAALSLADRLQSMTRRLGEAQEVERRRLAAELHDGVCSNLAAIGLNLTLLQKQLPQSDAASLQRRLADLIAQVDEAKANAKDISVDLRPLLLEDRDLLTALEEYARKFEGNTGIAVTVNGATAGRRLPADKKIALFRIAQEALTNCAKHARANAVAIEFNADAGSERLRLSVADDGVGIDMAGTGGRHAGLGLLSMQERAEAIGARWQIESSPGKGTRVTVSVGAYS